jgi:streptogramin lyase
LVFAPASTNALVFDSDRSKVLLLQNVSTTPATLLLSEGLPEVSGDALLQFDTSTAWVGAVGGKQLSRIDLQTLQVDTIALSAGLAMLQPLLLPHRFLLSAQPGQAAWVLDSGAAAYNVYFVPPQLAMGLR